MSTSTRSIPLNSDSIYGYTSEDEHEASLLIDRQDDSGVHKNEEWALSTIPNLWIIEAALFTNVFLSGFDGTVTASTYQTIGNDFNHMDISSWVTTAYLITSTSFQPLYGSFSDIFGRRKCLFFANTAFSVGCLGCGLSSNIFLLSFMRALAGVGGGGLITLSTIVNSDVIPSSKRGLFQAFQNLLLGLGAIFGASFGGSIAETIGWRWCFLIQAPISILNSLVMSYYVPNQKGYKSQNFGALIHSKPIFRDIDITGSIYVIFGLTLQLLYLSIVFDANSEKGIWKKPSMLSILIASTITLILLVANEKKTTARAIIPLDLVTVPLNAVVLLISVLVGFASYAYLFTLPVFFQIVLGDSTAKAGLRLAIPSLFTPIGSFITGVCMSRFNCLPALLYLGTFLMFFGNFLFLFIDRETPNWLIAIFLIPANLGQGITFPTTLFTFIFAFSKNRQATATSTLYLFRSIGSVWGVAVSSGVVQLFASKHIRLNLKGVLSENRINELIKNINENSSCIGSVRDEIRAVIITGYELGTKRAHLLSTLLCLLALALCALKDSLKKSVSRS